jgi:hypothetical protein
MNKGYDGWKYGFKKKIDETKQIPWEWQFRAIEREYPTTTELVRYYYPSFATGNIKPVPGIMKKMHQNFIKTLEQTIRDWDNLLELFSSFQELHSQGVVLPRIYEVWESNKVSFESKVLMFLVIPTLNRIVSAEPYVWQKVKTEIEFHKRFYSMYISADLIKDLQLRTLDKFK